MSARRPLVIGLTGNIGTGKTTVAGMLRELGAEVIDADEVAHAVMRPGGQVHVQIIQSFGPEVAATDGGIDRKRLGAIVFADPTALVRLESIVHPATIEAVNQQVAAASSCMVVIEAIKLIESGMARTCDRLWVTACAPEQQIRRIMERGLTREEAELRVRSQPAQAEKVACADVVIDNSGPISRTRRQVRSAWQRMMEEEGAKCSATEPPLERESRRV